MGQDYLFLYILKRGYLPKIMKSFNYELNKNI